MYAIHESPKLLNIANITTAPYVGGKMLPPRKREDKNPAHTGPRAFAKLPPNMTRPFMVAR